MDTFSDIQIKELLLNYPEVKSLNTSYMTNCTEELLFEIDRLCPKLEELDITNSFHYLNNTNVVHFPLFQNLKKIIYDRLYHSNFISFYKNRNINFIEKEKEKHILIRTLKGKNFYFNGIESYSILIKDVKEMVGKRLGISSNEQRYIMAGKKMEDGRSLNDYNFGSTYHILHLVLRLRDTSNIIHGDDTVVDSNINTKIEIKDRFEEEEEEGGGRRSKYVKKLEYEQIGIENKFNFKFPLLSKKYCKSIISNHRKYSKEEFIFIIETLILPTFKFEMKEKKFKYEFFFVEYGYNFDSDFELHLDPSDYTLNICLESIQLSGSEIGFLNNYDLSENEIKNLMDIDKSKFEFDKIKFQSGDALLHKGNIPHITFPITTGRRINLIIWLDIIND